jgi:predicted helicase
LNDGPDAVFVTRSNGVQTNRDVWVYNFSKAVLEDNVRRMIDFYNSQVDSLSSKCQAEGKKASKKAQDLINTDPQKIKWTSELIEDLAQGKKGEFHQENIGPSLYRPFSKSWIYYDQQFNHRFKEKLFPSAHHENLAISVTGTGSSKEFSCLIVNVLPDLEVISKGQCFPLYVYEKPQAGKKRLARLFKEESQEENLVKKEAISDSSLTNFRDHYMDQKISKEDLFYYVYGVLHSTEYRERYADDLKKMLPRVPFATDFWTFSKAGRDLASWHLNYETVDPWKDVTIEISQAGKSKSPEDLYHVTKIRFGKTSSGDKDKSIIHFNDDVTISEIPLETYDYVVNGKPAIEWIMEQYQVYTDKESGILNDPNLWCEEHRDPLYIFNLLLRIIRVSMETVKIVKNLPSLETENMGGYGASSSGGELIAAEDGP